MSDNGSFERDTLMRMLAEAVRYWLVGHFLRRQRLPEENTFFVYANGPNGIDWGNAPGPTGDGMLRPLRGKRVRITLSIENQP